MFNHSLFRSLRSLKGNPRACVYTEPMWGIPYFLYLPYVSVYMLALGLDDVQVGLVISIGLAFQIVFGLLSGPIVDKIGRKKSTLVFDLIAWSIPCILWAVAQGFTFFVAAAVINAVWRITATSWTCLMVEDTDPDTLVDLYTWIYIGGLAAGFFAPLAGLFIRHFSLVPTMRGLFVLAFILMTAKFLIMNAMVTETSQGLVRMQETRGKKLLSMLGEYRGVFRILLNSPQALYTIGIMLVMSICQTINNSFWSILVTQKIHIPAQNIAFYPFARSFIMLIFLFLVIPRIRDMNFKKPLIAGFAGFILSQAVLISVPEKNYALLLVSTALEACSLAAVSVQIDRMVAINVDAAERARILSIIYMVVLLFTTPFGWFAGLLSGFNRILPFVLNMILFSLGGLLALRAARNAAQQRAVVKAAAEG